MKICSRCKVEKQSDAFYKSKKTRDGLLNYCKPCQIRYTTTHRSRRRSQEHTKRDILLSRWNGIRSRKDSCYMGIKVQMTKDAFLSTMDNHDLDVLFRAWVSAGRPFSLTPSIDRKDPRGDYELSNLQWLSLSENSRRGGKNRWINR